MVFPEPAAEFNERKKKQESIPFSYKDEFSNRVAQTIGHVICGGILSTPVGIIVHDEKFYVDTKEASYGEVTDIIVEHFSNCWAIDKDES